MKGCRQARRRIERALDEPLDLEERFALETHLAACPACARHHGELRRLEEAFLHLPEPPLARLDVEAAVAGVRAALAEEDTAPSDAAAAPAARTARRLVAGALVLLAGGTLLVLGLRHGHPEPVRQEPGAGAPLARAGEPVPLVPNGPVPAAVPMPSVDVAQGDSARLAELRGLLRRELCTAFAGLTPLAPAGDAAAAFEERVRTEAGREWSLRRNVEVLAGDPDPEVARAALRYLGRRGDVVSRAALERGLDRPELRASAVAALRDLGEAGVPALARELRRDPPRLDVLEPLTAIGGPAAASAVEAAALRAFRDAGPDPDQQFVGLRLADGLQRMGTAGFDPLLRLASELPAHREDLVSALTGVEGADARLVRLLDQRLPGHDRDVVLDALATLQPPEALPWLEEQAGDPRTRPGALRVLGGWRGAGVLSTLVTLYAEGRVPQDDVAAIARPVLTRDPDGATGFAEELVGAQDAPTAQELVELLLAAEHPAGGEALAVLALADLLSDSERIWAALAIGDLGAERGAERLARELPDHADADRRLLAACLVAIQAVAGRDTTTRVLARLAPGDPERLLAALSESRTGSLRLTHVARELARRMLPRDSRRNSTP